MPKRFNKCVDTDLVRMDWGACMPTQHKAHYKRQRSKNKEKKEWQEREKREENQEKEHGSGSTTGA